MSEDDALKNSRNNGVAAVNFVNLLETSYVSEDDAWKCSRKTSAPFANYANGEAKQSQLALSNVVCRACWGC